MHVDIHREGRKLTPGLKQFVQRKIGISLDRFEQRIQRISVTLKDANGPRGGVDQVCRIVLSLTDGGSPIVSSAGHDNAYGAIELAFAKLNRTISRKMARARRNRRTAGTARRSYPEALLS